MAKTLAGNVNVGGKWYGPSYPQNPVTDEVLEQITNPAAFDADAQGGHPDLRFRADDFAASRFDPSAAVASAPGYDEDANVDEVLAWVGEDPIKARQALNAEENRAKGTRSSLVSALEKIAGA